MSDNFNKERILKNSATLYVRMMFTMVLNLLTTRFVLAALGVESLGVYGVVGSVVSMFTVFVGGLLSATQRFVTFELGKADGDVARVFNTSTNLLLLLSAGLLVVMEVGGLLMVRYGLNLPERSLPAAHWVLQFSILTCVLNLNTTAYNALIIAHERMAAWACISMAQVALTCAMAYGLTVFAQGDRLVVYALMSFLIQLLIRVLYMVYCKREFAEARHQWVISRPIVREMVKFAGASTFSGVIEMAISQGLVLIVNWMYGVAVNAVMNIGIQVKNSVLSFGMNVTKSVAPQITKTYAAGEYERHCKLVYSGSKLAVFMTTLIFIPFCLRAHYILELWLGQVPEYTSAFTVGFVFSSLLYAGFEPFRAAVLATGHVGRFFVHSELVHLLVLPLAYVAGKAFGSPLAVVVAIVLMEFVFCGSMVWLGTRVSQVSARGMLVKVALPVVYVMAISFLVSLGVSSVLPDNFMGLCALLLCSSVVTCLVVYAVGLSTPERDVIRGAVVAFANKRIQNRLINK